jgi:hypothetical protein
MAIELWCRALDGAPALPVEAAGIAGSDAGAALP